MGAFLIELEVDQLLDGVRCSLELEYVLVVERRKRNRELC